MHLKLDELIRAANGARNHLLDLENLPDEELEALAAQFAALKKRAVSGHLRATGKEAAALPPHRSANV